MAMQSVFAGACLALLGTPFLVPASAFAQSRETAMASPDASVAIRPQAPVRPAPSATKAVDLVPSSLHNAGGLNQTIEAALGKFASRNAGNPQAQSALEEAAAQVNQNPAAFINADGAPNHGALNALVFEKFSDVGEVTVTSVNANNDTTYPNLGSMGDGDIEALAFIVLMQAAQSARDDLKTVMAGVNAINKQKEGLRHTSDAINQLSANCDAAQEPCALDDSDQRAVNGVLARKEGDPVSKKDINGAKETVKDKLDSLSEMGETESLRLQMAMDRLSKLMSTLSNLLKKSSDTASDITKNIK